MFIQDKEDYFTYVMVLWLPLDTDVGEQKLEKDLEKYFDGLAAVSMPGINKSNAGEKVAQLFDSLATRYSKPQTDLRAKVDLNPMAGDSKWEKNYQGSIKLYEGMVAHKPLELKTKVRLQKCEDSEYRVVFLEVSPRPYTHQLWNPLDQMAREWQCPEKN